jgi:hypothetical protein
MTDIFPLPPASSEYERLGREIDAMRPHVTEGSTTLFDFNKLVVTRRQLWMRRNGLGPRL